MTVHRSKIDQINLALILMACMGVVLVTVAAFRLVRNRPGQQPAVTTAVQSAEQHQKQARTSGMNMQDYQMHISKPDKTASIVVKDEKIVSGPRHIDVKYGSSVRINLQAQEEEVRAMLEGYNIITEHDPSDDTPGGFSFVADKRGTFNIYALGESAADGTPNNAKFLLGTVTVE
jgi:hypothetical protein